jgi:hypothetical protein
MFKTIVTVSLLALAGCGPFWVNPYITVEESHLNWVEFHYYNMNREPYRRISVFINGAGFVEVKKGTSKLISDDFAKKYDEKEWSDIKTSRIHVDPKHINEVFQNLVNHGVLDREKTGKGSKKEKYTRFIAVKANINNNTYSERANIFEADPDLAEQLLDVVRQFDNPTL